MIGLTPRQIEALDFINAFLKAHRYSPSYRELMDGLDMRSVSNAHAMIQRLVARGALAPIPKHSRRCIVPLRQDHETI